MVDITRLAQVNDDLNVVLVLASGSVWYVSQISYYLCGLYTICNIFFTIQAVYSSHEYELLLNLSMLVCRILLLDCTNEYTISHVFMLRHEFFALNICQHFVNVNLESLLNVLLHISCIIFIVFFIVFVLV